MDVLNVPRPAWMTEDLVLLEEQARRFMAAEFAPHVERWNEERHYRARCGPRPAQAGLLCAAIPEEYGGAGGTFAHEAVIDRELRPRRLRRLRRAAAFRHRRALHPALRHRGAEEALAAEARDRRADRRDRHDRAGHRLRPAGRAHHRDEEAGNGYVLNGSKTFITNGQHANLIIVVAKTDPKEAPRASR